nr:hypothetical protein [Candidatus Sigynarchaeota archaeon]
KLSSLVQDIDADDAGPALQRQKARFIRRVLGALYKRGYTRVKIDVEGCDDATMTEFEYMTTKKFTKEFDLERIEGNQYTYMSRTLNIIDSTFAREFSMFLEATKRMCEFCVDGVAAFAEEKSSSVGTHAIKKALALKEQVNIAADNLRRWLNMGIVPERINIKGVDRAVLPGPFYVIVEILEKCADHVEKIATMFSAGDIQGGIEDLRNTLGNLKMFKDDLVKYISWFDEETFNAKTAWDNLQIEQRKPTFLEKPEDGKGCLLIRNEADALVWLACQNLLSINGAILALRI